MRLRLVEQPWELAPRQYVVEVWSGEFWQCAAFCESEGEAREFAALYAQGPRVIEEFDYSAMASAGGGPASLSTRSGLSS